MTVKAYLYFIVCCAKVLQKNLPWIYLDSIGLMFIEISYSLFTLAKCC